MDFRYITYVSNVSAILVGNFRWCLQSWGNENQHSSQFNSHTGDLKKKDEKMRGCTANICVLRIDCVAAIG
jgi:hypothetical protein